MGRTTLSSYINYMQPTVVKHVGWGLSIRKVVMGITKISPFHLAPMCASSNTVIKETERQSMMGGVEYPCWWDYQQSLAATCAAAPAAAAAATSCSHSQNYRSDSHLASTKIYPPPQVLDGIKTIE